MDIYFKYIRPYNYRLYFFMCFTIVGLFTSQAIMSIGMIAIFCNILLDFILNPRDINTSLNGLVSNKKLLSQIFLFLSVLFALSYSTNKPQGWAWVLNKLPFLVVPLALGKLKTMSKKEFRFILQFFVLAVFISSLAVLYKYIQNYEVNNLEIKKGKAIWVPYNHIRFNTMLVFAFFSSLYLLIKNQQKWSKFGFLLGSFFFFMMIHFLSVRSGVLVLYLGLLSSIFFYTIKYKEYLYALIGLSFLALMPVFAYQNIESFRNKISYMKYDWEQYQKKEIGSNSDAKRMISYKAGIAIAKECMPFGLGTGSIKDAMYIYYKKHYPEIQHRDRISPHNQFLFTLVDSGILAFIALIVAIFYPLYSLKNKLNNLFYILFWLISFTPLLFDISLERQLGITFFALFSSLFIKKISLEEHHV